MIQFVCCLLFVGVVFGQAGVGGAVAALLKLVRLRTTEQLFNFCVERKRKQLAEKTEEYCDLHKWVFLHMQPPKYPITLVHVHQLRLNTMFCWESFPLGFGQLTALNEQPVYIGGNAVKITCHGVGYKKGSGTTMRLVGKPTGLGEYMLVSRKPGYPKAIRTAWKLAPLDVQDCDVANHSSLGDQREFMSGLSLQQKDFMSPPVNKLTLPNSAEASKRGRKTSENAQDEAKCNTRMKWTKEELGKNVTDFLYRDLQQECKDHSLSQDGKVTVMLKRVKAHYEVHAKQTERTLQGSLTKYFKQV
jgi:hypothetical protein